MVARKNETPPRSQFHLKRSLLLFEEQVDGRQTHEGKMTPHPCHGDTFARERYVHMIIWRIVPPSMVFLIGSFLASFILHGSIVERPPVDRVPHPSRDDGDITVAPSQTKQKAVDQQTLITDKPAHMLNRHSSYPRFSFGSLNPAIRCERPAPLALARAQRDAGKAPKSPATS